MIGAVIFDVFGSLVNWRTSVAREISHAVAGKGITLDATALAVAWRAEYQPGMERIRSGARGYVPLDVIHRENLDEMLRKQDLSDVFTLAEKDALSHAWEKLDPWPDVVAGLSALRTKGYLIAPCSNGSIALMSRLARHADFAWDAIVGAEVAQDYKPKAEVYLASARALGFAPGDVMMAAAHNNDLEAARDAGLQTGFFPRLSEHGPGQTTDLTAEQDWDIVAEDVIDLAERLPALSGL